MKLMLIFIALISLLLGGAGAIFIWGNRASADNRNSKARYDWFVEGSIGSAAPTSKLSEELAVFAAPKTIEDVPPPVIRRILAGFSQTTAAGTLEPGESRLLLIDRGRSEARLYALPTAHGWVCYATTTGVGSCLSELAGSVAWTIQHRQETPGSIVHGLVANDVNRVEVVMDGGVVEATTSRNAFYLEMPHVKKGRVRGLRIYHSDGRIDDISIE